MRYSKALALMTLVGVSLGCGEVEATDADPTISSATAAQAGAGAFERVGAFGNNPGGLIMYRYVPPMPRPDAPLLVAMHACSQNAPEYRKAGWEPLADAFGFYVLYPEQARGNNGAGCFNWAGEYGDPTNLIRGRGENRSIISMVEQMQADFDIDPSRIFATGHSGGAAQTALMLATWPDVFAGGAMIAGIPYDCTTSFNQVSTCLSPGLPRDPQVWGDSVRAAFPAFEGPYPKVSIWQGTNDFIVNAANGVEMLDQWTDVHGLGLEPDVVQPIDGHARSVFLNEAGEPVIEYYVIQGGGHGTFVDPDQGCGTAGAFFLDSNICSSRRIAEFFGLVDDAPPVEEPPVEEPPVEEPPVEEPPVEEPDGLRVDFVAPAEGDVVAGTVVVEVEVSEPAAEVTFTVNGAVIGVAQGAPHRIEWNTLLGVLGEKTLTAEAVTADGTRSDAVIRLRVGIGNGIPSQPPVDGGPDGLPSVGCSTSTDPTAPGDGPWFIAAALVALRIRARRHRTLG